MQVSRRIEEEILLFKIRHGDEEAFARVYDKYVDALFRFILFRVKTKEQAQDIVAELFLKLWQHLRNNNNQVDNLRAFLYRMARNLVVDYYRERQEELPLDEAIQVSDEAGGSRYLSPQQQVSLSEIEVAIKKLKPAWQEVIVLAHVEGFKPKEIAKIIGKTPAATRVIIHRALQELKKIIG
ncbi:RNA polymerase sigma factor [Patescibacteria group bacterium]|nr:RNA polymerase sigma factor [Patescibacteria group bacterium]